jgi:hypothetical protein
MQYFVLATTIEAMQMKITHEAMASISSSENIAMLQSKVNQCLLDTVTKSNAFKKLHALGFVPNKLFGDHQQKKETFRR